MLERIVCFAVICIVTASGCAIGTVAEVAIAPEDDLISFTKRIAKDMTHAAIDKKVNAASTRTKQDTLSDGTNYTVVQAPVATSKRTLTGDAAIEAIMRNYERFCVDRYQGNPRSAIINTFSGGSTTCGISSGVVYGAFIKQSSIGDSYEEYLVSVIIPSEPRIMDPSILEELVLSGTKRIVP